MNDSNIHSHLRVRMLQCGVTKKEIEETLEKGKDAKDAKLGTYGKVLAFLYKITTGKASFTRRKRLQYIISL